MFCDPTIPLQDKCLKEIPAQALTGVQTGLFVVALPVGVSRKLDVYHWEDG